ncbi:MAG: TIGR00270 family protein [Candidatus Lokiarchaeota archaeon]|nr:TIGR00270 family protein [Candidatus Lokiarchaeota archaeon]
MYTCELCGELTDRKIFRTIEGVKMLVCQNCSMLGEKPKSEQKPTQVHRKTPSYYLDQPQFIPRSTTKPVKKNKVPPQRSKNIPIDRLQLVDNYRNILKKIRKDNDLDQNKFANSVGITLASYRHIESGKLDLTIQEAKRIEKKFDVNLTELISDFEEDTYDQYLHGKSSRATLGDVYVKRKK